MTDKLVNGERVPLTPEEQAEYDARQTVGDAEQAEREERIDRAAQLQLLHDKALAVWRGTDTFTPAQVQKILAGLVLRSTR